MVRKGLGMARVIIEFKTPESGTSNAIKPGDPGAGVHTFPRATSLDADALDTWRPWVV
ncbi:hypothetical protein ACIA58_19150 [Kribbella sp. NPDC051586]|uniref:hypothetical protein n=1 Tax=Kribbella sp. NPDC051586 TaxID=3364118 RepID=UPI00378CBE02